MVAHSLGSLVARIARGDERAFARLHDQTSRVVYALALQAVDDAAAAEEIALAVYMQVWRTAAEHSSGRQSVTAWLIATTREFASEWTRNPPVRETRTMYEAPLSLFPAPFLVRKDVS